MTIDRTEAASALAMVDRSRRYAAELRNYAGAGSILIAWGLVWFVCNLAAQVAPARTGIAWLIGIAAATLWTVTRPAGTRDWRVATTFLAVIGYMLLMLVIVGADARTANAVISLLVAACYVILGAWTGRRILLLGLALAAAVVIGWFVIPAWLYLCMAIGGGGTLIAGGLWLRQA